MIHINNLDNTPQAPCRVAFGYFDGMHLGHQAVIRQLCANGPETPVLLSFAQEESPVIYTEAEKEYLLKDSGVHAMISMDEAQYLALDAESFVRDILAGKLGAKTVVAGEGVRFGAEGADISALAKLAAKYGISVEAVPTVLFEGEPVSAEAIRQTILDMDFARMRELLGRTYIMRGVVVHGKAAGRKHGMPTANLGVAPNKLFPPHGVYGTLSYLEGQRYRGMTNIGLRPSDDDIPIATIETFILNFEQDIYGKEIILEVFTYIRGVKKFAGLDEVRKQVDKDIESVRAYMDEVVGSLDSVK